MLIKQLLTHLVSPMEVCSLSVETRELLYIRITLLMLLYLYFLHCQHVADKLYLFVALISL